MMSKRPAILMFQINRMEFWTHSTLTIKNNEVFDFPEILNLGDFLMTRDMSTKGGRNLAQLALII